MPKLKPRAPIPPFRADNLLTKGGFIAFCKNRGVKTNKGELEFFDKKNLVTPAVVIYRPIGRVKNVDGKMFFAVGAISHGKTTVSFDYFGFYAKGVKRDELIQNTSLDDYTYYQPAKTKFVPWKNFHCDELGHEKRKSDLGKPAEPYYSPEQIFALVLAQQAWTLYTKGEGLLRTGARWEESAKKIRKMFDKDNESLTHSIEKRHRAISVFYDAEDLWFDTIRKKVDWFNDDMEEMIPEDFESTMERWNKNSKPIQIEKLLEKHGLTKNELRKLIEPFIYSGFNTDPNIGIWEYYRSMVSISWMKKQKGAALFCEDYYRIARRLLWLLQPFENNLVTLKDYYSTRGQRLGVYCLICNGRIEKNKTGGRLQKTCGQEKCKKALEKRRKQKMRNS